MKISSLLLAGAMLVGSVGLAVAQPAPGGAPGGGRGGPAECTADMAKFCADKTGPDARQCRTDNLTKFSDACQKAIAARAAAGGGAGGGAAP